MALQLDFNATEIVLIFSQLQQGFQDFKTIQWEFNLSSSVLYGAIINWPDYQLLPIFLL